MTLDISMVEKMGGKCKGTRIQAPEIHPTWEEEGQIFLRTVSYKKNSSKGNDSDAQREKARGVICVIDQRRVVKGDEDGVFEFPKVADEKRILLRDQAVML